MTSPVQLDDFLHRARSRRVRTLSAHGAEGPLETWLDAARLVAQVLRAGDENPRFDITSATEKAIAWLPVP